MRENRDFVVPVNILSTFAHAPFSWAARHTTVCLDSHCIRFLLIRTIKFLLKMSIKLMYYMITFSLEAKRL